MSLSPTLSSNLARDVYALSKLPSLRLAIADLKDTEMFSFSSWR
jgi:hypothetical protein